MAIAPCPTDTVHSIPDRYIPSDSCNQLKNIAIIGIQPHTRNIEFPVEDDVEKDACNAVDVDTNVVKKQYIHGNEKYPIDCNLPWLPYKRENIQPIRALAEQNEKRRINARRDIGFFIEKIFAVANNIRKAVSIRKRPVWSEDNSGWSDNTIKFGDERSIEKVSGPSASIAIRVHSDVSTIKILIIHFI